MSGDTTYRTGTVVLVHKGVRYTVYYVEEAVDRFYTSWSSPPSTEAEQYLRHYLRTRFGPVTVE